MNSVTEGVCVSRDHEGVRTSEWWQFGSLEVGRQRWEPSYYTKKPSSSLPKQLNMPALRTHLPLIRRCVIKKMTTTVEDIGERNPQSCWWGWKWFGHCGYQYRNSSKTKPKPTVAYSTIQLPHSCVHTWRMLSQHARHWGTSTVLQAHCSGSGASLDPQSRWMDKKSWYS